ncbi:MAG: helix-turn-helix transcriptional regulator [Pirellulales bacterium]
MGLSTSQFDRTFRKYFGTSPRQYLLRVRVEAACRQLAESNHSIATIALATGFHDHAHLTRTFRQVMGQSPSGIPPRTSCPSLSAF